MRRLLVVALATSALVISTHAQQHRLTLSDIFGAGSGQRFNGKAAASLQWLRDPWVDNSHFLWPGDDVYAVPWLTVDAVTGQRVPLFEVDHLITALARLPGVSADRARTAARRRPAVFNRRRDGLLVTVDDDLFYYDIAHDSAIRLTEEPGLKEEASISPDGRMVAFIRANNLFVTSIASPSTRRLTSDGNSDLLNGKLDWVYSEELYGRGNHRAYWWSPDSSNIAFLQLNEKGVPTYTLVDDLPYDPTLETWRYPKAGDPNPTARLGIVPSTGGPVRWVDLTRYNEVLLVAAGWTPDSRAVVYQVQDRQQTWLDLNVADADTGRPTRLFQETSKTWVERWDDDSADPIWLKDGSFLWLSERTGWRHVYHYRRDGSLIRQVTRGEWEVRSVDGIDEVRGLIYFSGTERSVLGRDVYRVTLDGRDQRRLTSTAGTHSAIFNPDRTMYLDSWTDATTPPQVRLHRSDGSEMRVVESNPVPGLNEFALSKPDFLQVTARDGFVMEAVMIKPPDFDPTRKYPVYQHLYAGPHLQTVANRWRRSEYMYHQLLAQRGVIVWLCDNRTASGKGAVSAWPLFRNVGESELRDIEDCLSWLKRQPYVDSSKIGVEGYSYGGFMVTYALTHPSSFSMGIAGGAVTDWRDYDTIYTERYMGLPRENLDGYRKSSPRFDAANLHGELLLMHSMDDDNVHPQNVTQFIHELQKAGKQFQMMMYPNAAHGLSDPQVELHGRQLMLDFTLKALTP